MRHGRRDTKERRSRLIDFAGPQQLKHRWNIWVILGKTRSGELAGPAVCTTLSITVIHCGAAVGVGGIRSVPNARHLESIACIFHPLTTAFDLPPSTCAHTHTYPSTRYPQRFQQSHLICKAEISIKTPQNNAYSHSWRGGIQNEPFIQFTFYLKWKFLLSGKAIKWSQLSIQISVSRERKGVEEERLQEEWEQIYSVAFQISNEFGRY